MPRGTAASRHCQPHPARGDGRPMARIGARNASKAAGTAEDSGRPRPAQAVPGPLNVPPTPTSSSMRIAWAALSPRRRCGAPPLAVDRLVRPARRSVPRRSTLAVVAGPSPARRQHSRTLGRSPGTASHLSGESGASANQTTSHRIGLVATQAPRPRELAQASLPSGSRPHLLPPSLNNGWHAWVARTRL